MPELRLIRVIEDFNMNKKLRVEFLPGCFDEFEGSQEELDDLIKEIHRLAESGELVERSRPVDMNFDDEDEFISISNKPRTLN